MEKILAGPSMLPESSLIRKIMDGETALFEIIIRRHNAALYKVARCYGFNHQDAEDLMQETYVSAYLQLSKFENRSLLKTWLTRILIHKCLYKINHGVQRHERPAAPLTEKQEPMLAAGKKTDGETAVLQREFSSLLEHNLQQLPVHYKTVFVLRVIQGFSVAETAEMLSISPVNVKVRLNRAKALLQEKLELYYSSADIFEFHLMYCDKMVAKVLGQIRNMGV